MKLEVRPYLSANRMAWDSLVRNARNGVFLFERDYLEYHADRFTDASWIVWRGEQPVALLPGHRIFEDGRQVLMSHGGLTFGGVVLDGSVRTEETLEIVESLCTTLRADGWCKLRLRPVPHIFHRQPSEDEAYALIQLGARIVRSDLAHTLDLARRPPLASGRRSALARARRAGVQVCRTDDWRAAWPVVQAVLESRHATQPAHALHEIQQLADRFKDRIALHCAYRGGDHTMPPLAVAVTYAYDGAFHTQYLAASEEGRELGALDALISSLMDQPPAGARWLSFGASTYRQGRLLNAGLATYKEMFGARPTLLMTFELALKELK